MNASINTKKEISKIIKNSKFLTIILLSYNSFAKTVYRDSVNYVFEQL